MDIKRTGSQPYSQGKAEWFPGNMPVDPLFDAAAPARVFDAYMTFEPGSRAVWHADALSQILIVMAGWGRVLRWDGTIEEINPRDVVWIAFGKKHWHGDILPTAMCHIAIQEAIDGYAVSWLEHVTDEQYLSE